LDLETTLTCEECGLVYAVYGKFAYCPDCGIENTLQIFKSNMMLIMKLLKKAESEENPEYKEYLIHNALEDIVSKFDSFGKNSINEIPRQQ